ncbi:MFS transporter [Gordonibacter sp. 28C]|uniref:MFS transporter n=1 Tax=Gordonibacter sp. 28C TaxID=2078569 RepID=UPI00131440E1|nr:MFS transporter [Gordonibacter sp. 28C]
MTAKGEEEHARHRCIDVIRGPNGTAALVAVAAFLVFGLNSTETSALPAYVMELGGGPFVASLQNSLFVLIAVLLRIPLERVVVRRGCRFAMVLGALGYTVPCLLLAGCSELWQVLSLRLAQALGLAAFQPSVSQYLTASSPSPVLGRHLGIVRFATTASLMVGPVSVFPLIVEQGYGAFFTALAVVGACGTAIACALPGRKPAAASKRPAQAVPRSDASDAGSLQMRQKALLLIGPFLLASGYSVVMNFGQLLSRSALAGFNDGVLFTCLSAGGLVGSLAAGWAADRFGPKRAVACTIAANGLGLLLMGIAVGPLPVLTGSLLCGAGYFGGIATLIAAAGTSLGGGASTFLARQQSGLDLGMIVGGLAAGLMMQAGLPLAAAFSTASAAAAAALLAWGMMYPRRKDA